jgi:large subunit ribosomal protein L9
MSGIAELLANVELQFFSKAGETGKLYGSITSQMIVDELNKRLGTTLDRHQIEIDPIRTLGEHLATVRLTVDLNPKIKVFVNREGEAAKVAARKAEEKTAASEAEQVESVVEETEVIEEPAAPEVELPETVVEATEAGEEPAETAE